MATIKLTDKQLRLVQSALDLYSRIGTLHLDVILDHPSVNNILDEQFTSKKELEVGDRTVRGVITEINKKSIKTKGWWGNGGEEIKTWTDIDKIKLSPDWDKVHRNRDLIKNHFNQVKVLASGINLGEGGNLGIYNSKVDNSCRMAFDMLKVIRHEFWKVDPKKSHVTVDSSVDLDDPNSAIEVELDTIKEIRKQKLKKIQK